MYIIDTHRFPKFTFSLNGAAAGVRGAGNGAARLDFQFSGARSMHDLLIAIVFVVMIASPAIVAAIPRNDAEDDT
jgi:hypothetical protein